MEQKLVHFSDLVGLTFSDGSVHLRHLEMLFKILVTHLKLDDVEVSFENPNLLITAEDVKVSRKAARRLSVTANDEGVTSTDPVVRALPRPESLLRNIRQSAYNPIEEMLNLLNITKRVEAVEVSLHKMTSLLETLINKENELKRKVGTIDESAESIEKLRASIEEMSSKGSAQQEEESFNVAVTPNPSLLSLPRSESYRSCESQTSKTDEIEAIVKVQLDAALQPIWEKLEKLAGDVCDLQKQMHEFKEHVDDVMFSNEQTEGFLNETKNEIKEFNAKIFCMKCDIKVLAHDFKEAKKNLVDLDFKYEALNNVKTNKSYVDELASQKAYKSDLEKFVKYHEFNPICDVLQLKVGSLDNELEKSKMYMKRTLACFQTKIDDKLEVEELQKFKSTVAEVFEGFLDELRRLIPEFVQNAGHGSTEPIQLNCLACESKIKMTKSAANIPRLNSASQKFKLKLEKIVQTPTKKKFNAGFRDVFGKTQGLRVEKSQVLIPQTKSFLNFGSSLPCFKVDEDKKVVQVNPIECVKNS